MRKAIVTGTVLTLLAPLTASAAAPPNVLVVMTDDQRAEGTMQVMPQTRRLIGRRGTTFTEAHATTPRCCPSRATFFSARYAHNHGVLDNDTPQRLGQRQTVQRFLRRRGYRTAVFGKYLNSWPLSAKPPFFDEWSITHGAFENGEWNTNGRVREVRGYNADVISDRAVRFIRRTERRADKRPWLAWLMPSAPHLPSTPAKRHRDAPLPRFPATPALLEDDVSDKPAFLDNVRGYDELIAAARDDGRRSLMAVDDMVGRLVRELRRRDELGDTLFVFTSDNGMLLGDHGGLVGKDLPYVASTKIPLMVRWPGRMPKRATRRDFVTNVDIATTIMRVAGVRRETDGKSLLSRKRRGTLFGEAFGAARRGGGFIVPPWRMLRTKSYRYTEYRDADGEILARELYDLRADPWELENRAASLPSRRIQRLGARLDRLARCKGPTCP